MKTNIGQTIKKLREAKGLNQEELGAILGVSDKTISSWEINRTEPKMGIVQRIADLFGVSTDYLISGDERFLYKDKIVRPFVRIPLYNLLLCRNGVFSDENIIEYITLPSTMVTPNKDYFAQYATGSSMIGENIHNGDLIVFEKAAQLLEGQIGFFCIDDNTATCKKYHMDNSTNNIILEPANKDFPPIVIDLLTASHFKILGRLAFVINDRQ